MAHGQINHIELPADDPQRAMRFLRGGRGLGVLDRRGHARLLVFRFADGSAARRQAWREHRPDRPQLHRGRLDRGRARGRRAGRAAPSRSRNRTSPAMGWFAVLNDPEGNEVGLFQSGGPG
jgi:catechol 2,3-dioxygenase-like lactoylglutathione lyase family enzyme